LRPHPDSRSLKSSIWTVGECLITVLAGGVGAARFLQGLAGIHAEEDIVVISNTADDFEFYDLHISPDIDIVMYTLVGLVDEEKGWGIEQDTFHCQETLGRLGYETWFKLGDRDLATHVYRTNQLRKGFKLSEVTRQLSKSLGLKATILPMTNDRVETRILTEEGDIHFEEYMVKRQMRDKVRSVKFSGIEKAEAGPNVIESIQDAEAIIVAPSNPIVSIGPILAVKGIRDTLKLNQSKVVAISPIIKGSAIKGPADKLMRSLGLEVSAFGVSQLYRDFLHAFVLDELDKDQKAHVESLGIKVAVTNTLMKNLEDKKRLAKTCLNFFSN
jgi:LPPG:FO 2-phospho-L-lactate transferase